MICFFYNILILFVFCVNFPTVFAQKNNVIFNRVLVEIYNQTYTQLDVELYVIIKTLIGMDNNKPTDITDIVNQDKWEDIIKEFVIDTIINNDFKLLNIYRPDEALINEHLNKINNFVQNNENFKHVFNKLEQWGVEIKSIISWVLSVEFYKNYNALKVQSLQKLFMQQFNKELIIINLDQKKLCRFYPDAFIYKPIMLTYK